MPFSLKLESAHILTNFVLKEALFSVIVKFLLVFTRQMSRWFGFGSSEGVWLCVDTVLGGDFYRWLLGICHDGLVLVPWEVLGLIQ